MNTSYQNRSMNQFDRLNRISDKLNSLKLLLIGNSSVGKSSLLLRFVDNTWDDNFVPTIGVDFVRKFNIIILENKNIRY